MAIQSMNGATTLIRTIIDQHPSLNKWAGEQLGIDFRDDSTIAIADGDKLIAVLVYNTFEENNLEVSIASISPKWATRRTLRTCFSYAFEHVGVNRLTARIKSSNDKAQNALQKLGFSLEGTLREYYTNGDDCLVYGMLINECRWIK